jgi:hypothetical protein
VRKWFRNESGNLEQAEFIWSEPITKKLRIPRESLFPTKEVPAKERL